MDKKLQLEGHSVERTYIRRSSSLCRR